MCPSSLVTLLQFSSFTLFKWIVLFSCTHLGLFFVFLYLFIKSFIGFTTAGTAGSTSKLYAMTLQDVTSKLVTSLLFWVH